MHAAVVAAVVALGCGPMPPRQRLPELEQPSERPVVREFRERTAMLRATLARSHIALDDAGGAIHSCEARTRSDKCMRCDIASGLDGIAPDLIDRVALAIAMVPPKLLEASAIERVVLCRRLRFENQPDDHDAPQGAADPEHRRLMVSVEAFVGRAEDTYSIEQIVHHELYHLFDPNRVGDDAEWLALRPPGFTYRDPADLAAERPAGFVNAYATTNEREDRASVYEYLMSHADRLCEYAATDPVLAAKTALVWRRIAAVAGDAFLRAQAPCIDWIESPGSAGARSDVQRRGDSIEIGPRPAKKMSIRMR